MRYILYILFFILSCCITNAAEYPSGTYYVDFTGGSDASADPTNVATPWKTLTKVADNTFVAPTTIKLKKGETWTERLLIPSSGTAGNHFTVTSYGDTGAKPIIDLRVTLTDHTNTGWSSIGGGVWTYSQENVAWLHENGYLLKKASAADQVGIDGSWFAAGSTVTYKPKTGTEPADNLIQYYTGSVMVNINAKDYVTLDGLDIRGGAIYTSSASARTNFTLQNCSISHSGGFIPNGSHTGSYAYIVIQSNTFDYNDNNVYLADGVYTNITIQDNVITHSNQTYWGEMTRNSGDADGLSLQSMSDAVIQRNEISGGCWGSAGIVLWNDTDIPSNNVVITKNYIHNVEGGGICIGGGADDVRNVTITYNIISNYGSGVSNVPSEGYWGGIRIDRIQSSLSLVANNTIYNGDIGIFLASLSDYYEVKNNIVHTMSGYFVRANNSYENNVFSNNIYYPGSVGTPFYFPSAAKTWAQWTAVYGETNSLTSDPLFNSPTTGNFMLLPGSPAINAGTDVSLTTDYLGRALVGLPDIGAYEFYGAGIITLNAGPAMKLSTSSGAAIKLE